MPKGDTWQWGKTRICEAVRGKKKRIDVNLGEFCFLKWLHKMFCWLKIRDRFWFPTTHRVSGESHCGSGKALECYTAQRQARVHTFAESSRWEGNQAFYVFFYQLANKWLEKSWKLVASVSW